MLRAVPITHALGGFDAGRVQIRNLQLGDLSRTLSA